MEIQPTDFENAAFVVFIVLITRLLSAFDLNLYIPMSKVDENMKTAHKRDASRTEKFYFRKNLNKSIFNFFVIELIIHVEDFEKPEDEYDLMTINEIFNGKV